MAPPLKLPLGLGSFAGISVHDWTLIGFFIIVEYSFRLCSSLFRLKGPHFVFRHFHLRSPCWSSTIGVPEMFLYQWRLHLLEAFLSSYSFRRLCFDVIWMVIYQWSSWHFFYNRRLHLPQVLPLSCVHWNWIFSHHTLHLPEPVLSQVKV